MAFPAASFTRGSVVPPRIVAVNRVDAASGLVGVNVARKVDALYETVAGIRTFAALRNWKVLPLTVAGSIASLNLAVTAEMRLTPVAPVEGVRAITAGGVVSPVAEAAVVNDQVMLLLIQLPDASFTRGSVEPPRTVAVYLVDTARGFDGRSVAMKVDAL
jgi:hypothetical protein